MHDTAGAVEAEIFAASPPTHDDRSSLASAIKMAVSSRGQRRAAKKASDSGEAALLLAGDFLMSLLFVGLMSLTAEAAEALSKVDWGGGVGGRGVRARVRACASNSSVLCAPASSPTFDPPTPHDHNQHSHAHSKHTHTQRAHTQQVSGLPEGPLAIAVTIAAIVAFGPLCAAFGGAMFNPVHCVAFIAAGKDSAGFNLARVGAQTAGALVGAAAAVAALPEWLKE